MFYVYLTICLCVNFIIILHKRLVEDVLGQGAGDKVPMEKVVMLIWQFRDDPSVVTFMARFMSKVRSSCFVCMPVIA
jgi:hypothetical protein